MSGILERSPPKWFEIKRFTSQRVTSYSHPCRITVSIYMHVFIYMNILLLSSLNYLFDILKSLLYASSTLVCLL